MTDTKIKTLKTPDWKWIQKSKKNQTEKELDIEKSGKLKLSFNLPLL